MSSFRNEDKCCLLGNPQITFFKSVFRRHANFYIETKKLNFSSKPTFGAPDGLCKIPHVGDLLHKMYLYVDLPEIKVNLSHGDYKAFRWLNWIGHLLIKNIKFNIGQHTIDEYDGEWLHIWNELTQTDSKKCAYAEMVGNTPEITQIHSARNITTGTTKIVTLLDKKQLYIPLQFWFSRNPGLSLPIISLTSDTIEIQLTFEKLENLIWASHETSTHIRKNTGDSINGMFETQPKIENVYIYADYIYLDKDEKKRFIDNKVEYLIETVQIRGNSSTTLNNSEHSVNLHFTHPVKEIIWRTRPISYINHQFCQSRGGMQPYNYTDAYDFSGFSGTPEPPGGPGMPGGRNNSNMFYSLPGVKLVYETNVIEPKYNDIEFTNSSWNQDINTISKTEANIVKQTGYDFISKYHPSNKDDNFYKTQQFKNLIGTTNSNNNNYDEIWSHYNEPDTDMLISDSGNNPTDTATITLNGHKKFEERQGFYFNVIQPYQHHTSIPCPGLNVFSFSLNPEDPQPSGTCNFSHINHSELILKMSTRAQTVISQVRVYALVYTILKIENKIAVLEAIYQTDSS